MRENKNDKHFDLPIVHRRDIFAVENIDTFSANTEFFKRDIKIQKQKVENGCERTNERTTTE